MTTAKVQQFWEIRQAAKLAVLTSQIKAEMQKIAAIRRHTAGFELLVADAGRSQYAYQCAEQRLAYELNDNFPLFPGVREEVAQAIGVSADSMFHKAFDAAFEASKH